MTEIQNEMDQHYDAAITDPEMEGVFKEFAHRVGLSDNWHTDQGSDQEFDAMLERLQRVRLVDDREENEDEPRVDRFSRWRRVAELGGMLAAGVVLVFAGQLGVAAMHHHQATEQNAVDEIRLHVTPGDSLTVTAVNRETPHSFETASGAIRGLLLHGTLHLSYVGSAQDSAVSATLSAPSQVNIDVGPTSRGLVVTTPSAVIELLEPGSYTIAEQSDSTGYVQVVTGLARVDDRRGSTHGIATARTGEIVKTRRGDIPTRNLKD